MQSVIPKEQTWQRWVVQDLKVEKSLSPISVQEENIKKGNLRPQAILGKQSPLRNVNAPLGNPWGSLWDWIKGET